MIDVIADKRITKYSNLWNACQYCQKRKFSVKIFCYLDIFLSKIGKLNNAKKHLEKLAVRPLNDFYAILITSIYKIIVS